MNTRQDQMKIAERARNIHRLIESRILDLQTLKGGWIMSNKAFRAILKEHPQLQLEFDILSKRKECMRRFIFKNA